MFIVQEKIYTYSEDFFMTAFFTFTARGVSATVLVAGGGVTLAGGAMPATAIVTAPVAVVDGSVPTSWRLGSVIAIFWTGQKWAREQDGPRRRLWQACRSDPVRVFGASKAV
jgi:hypothetical protein